MTRNSVCLLIYSLFAIACGANPQGRIPAGTTDVFVGLSRVDSSQGQVGCKLLSSSESTAPSLAWASDADAHVLAMRISRLSDTQCDLTTEESARALLFLALGPLGSEVATADEVLTALRQTDVRELGSLLAARPSLEAGMADPRFAVLFGATAQQVAKRLSERPLGQQQSALSGLALIKDVHGWNGVNVTPKYAQDGKSVDVSFDDDGEINEVKGILMEDQLIGYLMPTKGYATYVNNLIWGMSKGPILTKVPAKKSPIKISVVSPATLRPDRELSANPTLAEFNVQSTATMASWTYMVYQFIEAMLMPGMRDSAGNKECLKDLGELGGEIIGNEKELILHGETPSWRDLQVMLWTAFVDADDRKPGPGILRSCLGIRIGERSNIWLKTRGFFSFLLRFKDLLQLGFDQVLDVGGGYPYLRHYLIGCTECGTSSPQCVDDRGCASGQFCQGGRCVADVCTADSLFCSGAELRRCNTSGSGSSPQKSCGGSCAGGQCCGGSGERCCTGSSCAAGYLCDRSGMCQPDATPTRPVYRYMHICTYAHWQSNNGACYPGSMSATQGCGVCSKPAIVNDGCAAATSTCWQREDDQTFSSYISDPGYGSFSRIWHCFDGGVNTYSRTGCGTYGDPGDIGWIADAPVGRFVRELALCERFVGGVAEHFLSVKADLECTSSGRRILAKPFGYVP